VIRFLQAEGHSAAEMHRRLCRVYGDNVMSDGSVRDWCRKFRDGRTDVHDAGGQGRHSIVPDELVHKVDQVVREKRRFTIFLMNFLKFRGLVCFELSERDWVTTNSVHGGYQNN
jgi:transposase